MTQDIGFTVILNKADNKYCQHQKLGSDSGSCSTNSLQSWKRSHSKDQHRIQNHIQHKPQEVSLQGSFGISLGCIKSGQSLSQVRKQDQSTGDQHVYPGTGISFRICQIKKVKQRICKKQAECSKKKTKQDGQLQSYICIADRGLPVFTAKGLCHIYLSAHTRQGTKSLGKPYVHAAYAYSCNCLGTKHSDPGHISDIVGCSQKRRCHNRQCQLRKGRKNRAGGKI